MMITMTIQLTNESVYRLFCLPFKRLEFLLQITLQVPICAFGCDVQQVLCKGKGQWDGVKGFVFSSPVAVAVGPTLIQPKKNREQ